MGRVGCNPSVTSPSLPLQPPGDPWLYKPWWMAYGDCPGFQAPGCRAATQTANYRLGGAAALGGCGRPEELAEEAPDSEACLGLGERTW